jgi:hypothetical protein
MIGGRQPVLQQMVTDYRSSLASNPAAESLLYGIRRGK